MRLPAGECVCNLIGSSVQVKKEWRSGALDVTLREHENGAVWLIAATGQLDTEDLKFLDSVSDLPYEAEHAWIDDGTHVFVVVA